VQTQHGEPLVGDGLMSSIVSWSVSSTAWICSERSIHFRDEEGPARTASSSLRIWRLGFESLPARSVSQLSSLYRLELAGLPFSVRGG